MRQVRTPLGAAVGLLLVAACTPDSGDSEGVATYRPRGTGGMDALLSATVAFENGCVYARSQEFDERWLPVFPVDDVQWDGQRLIALGGSYDIGAPIELPGGAVREPTSPHPVPDEFEIPEPCNTDYIWLVNQGQSSTRMIPMSWTGSSMIAHRRRRVACWTGSCRPRR